MIRPPGRTGVAFSSAADGDLRHDYRARASASESLGIDASWATVKQVHGAKVREVSQLGSHGEADGLWTRVRGLPLAVFTADCFGVVLHAEKAVGVAHAGWRGVRAGVVSELRATMTSAGQEPERAEVGPGIGPCCFEVGDEVSEIFPDSAGHTSWGTTSVDLVRELSSQLNGVDLWVSDGCTMHEEGWYSHRQDGTGKRLAAIGWRP